MFCIVRSLIAWYQLRVGGGVLVCALLAPSVLHAANFSDGFRWSGTISDGSPLAQGDATLLKWSIVPDGLAVSGTSSNLVGYLDGLYGVGPGGSDLTQRPWFDTLSTKLQSIAAKTGITFEYVADDAAPWTTTPATVGHGDIRLAGYDLPTAGELGRAELPAFGGDVLLDTANMAFANDVNLGSVFQHEIGHSLGLLHVTVPGHSVLMGTTTLPINGPQFDDLYALTRLYGDRHEAAGGNDSAGAATALGALTFGIPVAVGTSTSGQAVLEEQVDYVTVDGTSDADFYRIELNSPGELSLQLTPKGPTYSYTPSGLVPRTQASSELSNLQVQLLASDGVTPLASVDRSAVGQAEVLPSFDLPNAGTYYLKVTGQQNANQFYHLEVVAEAEGFANTGVLFQDRFSSAASSDLNNIVDTVGRQAAGRVDSPYDFDLAQTAAGDPTVQLDNGGLLMTAVRGDIGADATGVKPLRNFGPELVGERWLLSFELSLEASLASDKAVFALVLDDQWPTAEPLADAAELTLQIAADGDYRLVENGGNAAGEANRSGNRAGPNYQVQVLVDETFSTPQFTVGVNGATLLSGEQFSLGAVERYFSLHASTLPGLAGGEWIKAKVDDFSVSVLTDAIVGDYNLDGQVNLADYTVWRDALGLSVLAGTLADGNGNGIVDAGDYTVWKANFGTIAAVAANVAAVPEPPGIALLGVLVGFAVVGERIVSYQTRG